MEYRNGNRTSQARKVDEVVHYISTTSIARINDDRREFRFEFIESVVAEEIQFTTVASSSISFLIRYFGVSNSAATMSYNLNLNMARFFQINFSKFKHDSGPHSIDVSKDIIVKEAVISPFEMS